MPKHRTEIGRQIADMLFDYETSLDATLAKGAALAGLLPAARISAKVAAGVSQNAMESVITSMTRLSEARRAVVESHEHLEVTRTAFNLPVFAGGDKTPVPDPGGIDVEERQPLRAVS